MAAVTRWLEALTEDIKNDPIDWMYLYSYYRAYCDGAGVVPESEDWLYVQMMLTCGGQWYWTLSPVEHVIDKYSVPEHRLIVMNPVAAEGLLKGKMSKVCSLEDFHRFKKELN